jgi:integrase/recombinase XerD
MTRVSVLLRIRENGKYPFVTPVWLVPAKKLKPLWGVVKGVPTERPDGSYYLRYTHPETKKQRTEPAGKHAGDVIALRDAKNSYLQAKDAGLKVVEPSLAQEDKSRTTLANAIEAYISEQKRRRVKGRLRPTKSVASAQRQLRIFMESCHRKYLADITRHDLLTFMDFLEEKYESSWTVRNIMIQVLAFLRHSGRPGLLRYEEVPQGDPKPVKPYTSEQIRKLFAAANDRELIVMSFFLDSACREQEVAHAEKRDVDWEAKQLWIGNKGDFATKNRRGRHVPLSDELLEMLKAWIEAHPDSMLLFPSAKGRVEGHFLRILQEVAHRAGLVCGNCVNGKKTCKDGSLGCREFGLHKWRKTAATNWHQSGVPLGDIQAYLGHSSLEITRVYLAVSESTSPIVRARINAARQNILQSKIETK